MTEAREEQKREIEDPVHLAYIEILETMKNLCDDTNTIGIVVTAMTEVKGKLGMMSHFARDRQLAR
jgi:hypothetical protein